MKQNFITYITHDVFNYTSHLLFSHCTILGMEVSVIDTSSKDLTDMTFPSEENLQHTSWEDSTDSITIPKRNLQQQSLRGHYHYKIIIIIVLFIMDIFAHFHWLKVNRMTFSGQYRPPQYLCDLEC